MTSSLIILKIRSRVPLILLAALLTGCVAYIGFTFYPVSYTSDVSFYIDETGIDNATSSNRNPTEQLVMSTLSANKVLLFINSDELRDSLITYFHLYEHYGIDKNSQMAHELVLLKLNKAMIVSKDVNTANLFKLRIEDGDRNVAALIANKTIDLVNSINAAMLKADYQRKIEGYRTTISALKGQQEGERKEVIDFLSSVEPQLNKTASAEDKQSLETKLRGYYMLKNTEEYTAKYNKLIESYYAVVNKLEYGQWQAATVIRKAVPDATSKGSTLNKALLVMFASIFIYSMLLVFYYENEEEAKVLLFGKTKDE